MTSFLQIPFHLLILLILHHLLSLIIIPLDNIHILHLPSLTMILLNTIHIPHHPCLLPPLGLHLPLEVMTTLTIGIKTQDIVVIVVENMDISLKTTLEHILVEITIDG